MWGRIGQICARMCLREVEKEGRIMAKEVCRRRVCEEDMRGVMVREVGTGVR